jgi:HD-GYP domain-containing protein (c-di-GMP phosphodiesterase class II)
MNCDFSTQELEIVLDEAVESNVCDLGLESRWNHTVVDVPATALEALDDTALAFERSASTRCDVIMEFLSITEQTRGRSVSEMMADVLRKSREITCAEAGSIFILRHGAGGERSLQAASLQNDVIRVKPADFNVPVDTSSIAGYVAETSEILVINDLYRMSSELPYSFNRNFDEASGYRSRSMMCFPLNNFDGEVIGVVQLINRRGTDCIDVLPFTAAEKALILPVKQILGTAIERALMTERMVNTNAQLTARNGELQIQRERIAMLQGETEEAFQMSVHMLALAAEIHDEDTARHIGRTNDYSYFLAGKLGLPEVFCNEIRYSAQLHDVGKMSIDSGVLKKNGPLGPDERDEMNLHPAYGFQILDHSDRLVMAADIAHSHHEKWDGTGYPNGLSGEEIPIAARIVAMADIYDALRAERCYKPAFDHEKTCDIILHGDERLDPVGHFDPDVLATFREYHGEMAEIWDRSTR